MTADIATHCPRHRRVARSRPRPGPCPRPVAAGASSSTLATHRRHGPKRCRGALVDPRRRHRPCAPRRAGGRGRQRSAGSTCWSTTRATSARARCRRSPATRSTSSAPRLRDERARAARARQLLLPRLRAAGGTVLNISSDAAVEAYPGWGGYGSAKAALDHAQRRARGGGAGACASMPSTRATCARTMHQAAFPGEDISDRPEPETVVPALLRLLDERPPSGRYRAADLLAAARDCSHERAGLRAAGRRRGAGPADRARRRPPSGRARPSGIEHARFAQLAHHLEPGRPGRRQHLRDARRRGRRRPSRRHAGSPCTSPRRSTTAAGWSRSGPADEPPARSTDVTPGEAIALPDGVALVVAAPHPAGQRRLWRAVRRGRGRGGGIPGPARPPDPLRLRAAGSPAGGVPDRVRPRAGQRRDAQRRPAVHRRAGHRARRPAASASHRSRCTPASRRRSPESRRSPNGSACPRPRRGR